LTSNKCGEEKEYYLSIGMDDYIIKPIIKNLLFEKIENYIKENQSKKIMFLNNTKNLSNKEKNK
jgi:DNA-binding response OmpR family regulator